MEKQELRSRNGPWENCKTWSHRSQRVENQPRQIKNLKELQRVFELSTTTITHIWAKIKNRPFATQKTTASTLCKTWNYSTQLWSKVTRMTPLLISRRSDQKMQCLSPQQDSFLMIKNNFNGKSPKRFLYKRARFFLISSCSTLVLSAEESSTLMH